MHSRRMIPSMFVKSIQNLPFDFNVVHNIRFSQIKLEVVISADSEESNLLLSKTTTLRFDNSRYLFSTACLAYSVDFPLLSSIRHKGIFV